MDLAADAVEARRTLADAVGNGDRDAVLVSDDPEGPGLWTSGLKKLVYGTVAVSLLVGSLTGLRAGVEAGYEALTQPRDEISFQMDHPSIETFAERVGPRLFDRGALELLVLETDAEDSARFFTHLDPRDRGQPENECYAVYQPALRDVLGSEQRLENTMGVFAIAHCVMAGGDPRSVSNVVGSEELGRMMTNLAAARLIEGNLFGTDGQEVTDPVSVRDAWFGSQFSQTGAEGETARFDGIAAYLVLNRADEALRDGPPPGTVLELQAQALEVAERGMEDLRPVLLELSSDGDPDRVARVNETMRAVYTGATMETRLDALDAFMSDPEGATKAVLDRGVEVYLGGSARSPLDDVQVENPFEAAPAPMIRLSDTSVADPFVTGPDAGSRLGF